MDLQHTILHELVSSNVGLNLGDLDIVLEHRLGEPPDEGEVDDAILELLDVELIAVRYVRPNDSVTLVPFGEVTR